ncbi:metallophosphoesterase [Phenylobacterium sp.]|uniref:metallophosphoesterase family protein n=1 Tax=Phenylobacterium sp. TaxID=1871053 RepID=UPI0017A3C047|nr:metallophosphoesterase [Phenylobacterium sp.]MBA4793548.1 metallophosphoesterase [Phenylobacterium sp.]MBC7168169.1 metallophosphoesterase [Phenylobacterium sp.]
MIRLVQFSDVHFGDENAAAVEAATRMVCDDPPDMTIVTGDVTRFAEVHELEAARDWLARLPTPLMVTPGNHDAPYLAWFDRLFRPFARYERIIGPAWSQTHLDERVAVHGLNTARGAQPRMNWSKGQISRDQARQAVSWFAGAPSDRFRVVALHHPLTEMIGGPMTGKVWGGTDAARDFSEAGVDIVISGHVHAPFALPYPFADERTYAIGCGTLSVRERGVPAGFNIIEVDDREIRVRAQAWSGSHFEAYRTWSLDRRR